MAFILDQVSQCLQQYTQNDMLAHICRTVKATRQLLHSNKQEWQVSRPAGRATRATSRSSSTEWFHATRPPIPMSWYGHPPMPMPDDLVLIVN